MELGQIRQPTAMIKMKMSQQYQVDSVVDCLRRLVKTAKVWISSFIGVKHVDSSVEDNLFVFDLDEDT